MEYFLGSLITLGIFFYIRKAMANNDIDDGRLKIIYRQSHIHNLIKDFIPDYFNKKPRPKTQAYKNEDKKYTRVLFIDNSAYWIKDNALYMADLVDGIVEESTTRKVDTMAMDKVQLDRIMFIVEALTEGNEDDNSSSRN